MYKRIFLSVMCSLPLLSLHSATVRVINDSPFSLKVLVLSATGVNMGSTSSPIDPGSQYTWENSQVNTDGTSVSPFTVVFFCTTNGERYGTIGNVTTGGMVQASSCNGARYCPPKPQEKGKPKEPESDLQYKGPPVNPDQWREQNRY